MSIHFVSLSLQVSLPFHAAFGSALFNSLWMSGEGREDWPKNWVGRECGNSFHDNLLIHLGRMRTTLLFFPPLSIFTVPLHLTGTLEVHIVAYMIKLCSDIPHRLFLMVLGIKAKV